MLFLCPAELSSARCSELSQPKKFLNILVCNFNYLCFLDIFYFRHFFYSQGNVCRFISFLRIWAQYWGICLQKECFNRQFFYQILLLLGISDCIADRKLVSKFYCSFCFFQRSCKCVQDCFFWLELFENFNYGPCGPSAVYHSRYF